MLVVEQNMEYEMSYTSRKRSPKEILSPGSTKRSACALLAFEMIDLTPGTLLCRI